jgi:hypothetical protein
MINVDKLKQELKKGFIDFLLALGMSACALTLYSLWP